MRIHFVLCIMYFMRLATWPSWSGYGITTSWPSPKCRKEIKRINWLLNLLLPHDYFATDPMFAAGGALVIYFWRKDDPRAVLQLKQITPYRDIHRSLFLL